MDDDLLLVVGGGHYGGWTSMRVTRSIESLAGSFSLEVFDRWGATATPRPIAEEDPCRVEIGGQVVIDGYVDRRSQSGAATGRTLSYTGRDRAAALVDNSAVLPRWTYRNVRVADFVAEVARPFGVRVSVQPGLDLKPVRKVVITPGDTAYDAIRRAIADQEVLLVSDGAGGILITRSGHARATPLIEGQNNKAASVDYDSTNRFARYVLLTQTAGTDNAFGNATRIKAEAIDEGVRRRDRTHVIRPGKGYSVADARRRADWEARIRAARAETVTITVQGWRQPDGRVWPINAITRVVASKLIAVNGDMLITQAEHTAGSGGKITQLRLVRPDAFEPEPQVTARPAVKASGGLWKELTKGAL